MCFRQLLLCSVICSVQFSQCYRPISYGAYTLNDIVTSTKNYAAFNRNSVTPSVETKENINFKDETTVKPVQKSTMRVHSSTEAPIVTSTATEGSEIESSSVSNRLVIESTTVLTDNYLSSKEDVTPRNWNLVWRDDFEGDAGSLPSRENWIFDIGTSYPGGPANWGNREAQYYTDHPDNVCFDGKGNLKITPLRDENGNWTSARIETRRKDFKAPKGGLLAIEGRIHMPNVTGEAAMGYWPAFWALGSPLRGHYHNWPQIGEFDIMENVNGLNSVWGVLHCGLAPNDPCRETSGLGKRFTCPGNSCQTAFHTYRFEWDDSKNPTEMRWYVDGVQYHNVTADVIDEASWDSMTSHSGYFILLNVAIGGAFPNALVNFHDTPTNLTESGHPMLIDYVAVYDSTN